MKRSIRTLIIAVVVLAVLCGAYFVADKWKPGKKTEDKDKNTVPESKTIYVVNEKTDDVLSVDVFTGDTSYTVKSSENGAVLEGYSSSIISQTSLDGMLSSCAMIIASKEIKVGDNSLSDYGLDKKTRYVVVHLKNGNTKTVIIGDSAFVDGEFYAMAQEDNKIYSISSATVDMITKSPDSFRDTSVCSIDNTSVSELTIRKAGADVLSVKLEQAKKDNEKDKNDPAAQIQNYLMTYPYSMKASADKVSAIVQKLGAVSASEIVEENPSDLSKYGLSSCAELVVKDSSGQHRLRLGTKQEDNVYMMYNDVPVVYAAPCEYYDDVVNAVADDYVDRFIHIFNIDTVKQIDVQQGDKKHTLSIKGDTSKDGKATYKVDGKKAEESAFKGIYQSVIGITFTSVKDFAPTDKPSATIKFTFNDGKEKTFEYYTFDERFSYVKSDSGLGCITLTKNLTAIDDQINE